MSDSLKCPGSERLRAAPELFCCTHCGEEVEIWSDEKRKKCHKCKKFVYKKPPREPQDKSNFTVEVKEFSDESGSTFFYEQYETEVPLSYFDHDPGYKSACDACDNFGTNLACPPFSPYLLDYIGTRSYAKVICIRMPKEYFNFADENVYRECFRTAKGILEENLLALREAGHLIAGAGYCKACEKCVAADGVEKECRYPDKKIYSLESLGVNLTGLMRTCFDIKLEWCADDQSIDFICSIGAAFFEKGK